jgi:short-subunit dehydrogenase
VSATRPVALVTGASGGIGLELARLCAKGGHDLILVARRQDKLEEVAKYLSGMYRIRAEVIVADLARPEAPAEVVAEAERRGMVIDVLVNNAGVGLWGLFGRQETEQVLAMLQLNITSLTQLTRLVLPGMVHRRKGRILNVGSAAGFAPGPLMAVYYGTKAYVLLFSEAIADELRGTGVTVTALCPGVVPTGFREAAGLGGGEPPSVPGTLSAADVARIGYRGMMRGKRVVIPGIPVKLMIQGLRLVPRWLVLRVVRRFQERRG